MKFSILLASMAALVSADACDPKLFKTNIYNDAECNDLNEDLTKQYHDVPEYAYDNYKLGCHKFGAQSYELYCDADGSHQTVYKDEKCQEPAPQFPDGKIEYAWDKCGKMWGANLWVKLHTT